MTYFKFKKIEKDTKRINDIDFNTNLDNILNDEEISQDIDIYSLILKNEEDLNSFIDKIINEKNFNNTLKNNKKTLIKRIVRDF